MYRIRPGGLTYPIAFARAGPWHVHLYLGRYAEAESQLKRALAIQDNTFGPDDPELAILLNILVETYRRQGWHPKALGRQSHLVQLF